MMMRSRVVIEFGIGKNELFFKIIKKLIKKEII
jgi:hypothetical protein